MAYERPAEYEKMRKSSESFLREKPVGKEQKLTGYYESEKEKKKGKIPVEVKQLKGFHGTVAIGVNKDKKVTLLFAKDSSIQNRQEQEQFNSQRKNKKNGFQGKIYTNSHEKEKSALVYQEDLKKGVPSMMKRLRKLGSQKEQQVIEDAVPFLDRERDKEREEALLCLLRKESKNHQMEKQQEGREGRTIGMRLNEAQRNLAHKEQEERRFVKMLEEIAAHEKEYRKNKGWMPFFPVPDQKEEKPETEDGTEESGPDLEIVQESSRKEDKKKIIKT